MWWQDKAFNRKIVDSEGCEWHFLVWFDVTGSQNIQKIYFWDSGEKVTGKIELSDDVFLHFNQLKDRLIKIAKNKEYRNHFLCPLVFPIDPLL